MSFLDDIKQRALDVLHATTNALHAQLAATLMQAGHDVTPDDHADVLVASALNAAASTGKPVGTAAPNYADHALAMFSTSMSSALTQFAAAFLPAKFQPIAQTVESGVNSALVDGKVSAGEVVDVGLHAAAVAAAALVPGAAPLVGIVEPIVEGIADKVAAGESVADAAAPIVGTAAAVAAPAVTSAITEGVQAAAEAVSGAAADAVNSAFGKMSGGL